MTRAWTARISAVVLAGALALAGLPGGPDAPGGRGADSATVRLQEAANMAQFRAGNIISDAIFFNGWTWAAGDVQAFLQAQNPRCVPGTDGTPCLQAYTQSTPDRPADAYCQGYIATPNETAASIIMKVGRSCGVSQRVLLVMLQKEQGLVTSSGAGLNGRNRPWERYEKAMGFRCPDTAPCDPTYAGFFSQVYHAARQFKVYAAHPTNYGHRPGRTNDVRFHPNAACGTSSVYLENQATAGLYNYTPYQPNAAALAAGRGTGDACSAYGNRNFWGYYTDWFGSTYHLGADRITEAHIAINGNAGPLGAATSLALCGLARDGCGQQFERGSIYWSPATGAQVTSGAIRRVWMDSAGENGVLGYPRTGITCGLTDDGCIQEFEGGTITWSPAAGSQFTNGAVRAGWVAAGREAGALGYPTTAMACGMVGNGCGQQFEHGSVYWTAATGAHAVTGRSWDHWVATGWERGPLGYATSPTVCAPDGLSCRQDFQGATVFLQDGSSVVSTSGAIRALWQREGAEAGRFGKPRAEMVCGTDGCRQDFATAVLTWAPTTGVRFTNGAIGAAWAAAGRETGPLGYPSSTMACGMVRDGCGQQFQGGSVYWTAATGARPVTGPIWDFWVGQGFERGSLGYATADMVCASGGAGCRQEFEGATVTWAPSSGARATNGAIRAAWVAAGRETGPLGYPSSTMGCGMVRDGCGQQFQGGSVYWSPATGAHPVTGPIWTYWTSRGWERGSLGYAVADMICGSGSTGCRQDFQTETVTWNGAAGAQTTSGAIRSLWLRNGAQSGPLGQPTAPMQCGLTGNGCSQTFQGGTVTWTAATGAVSTSGAIAASWTADGAQSGSLGYPVAEAECGRPDGGCRQTFQGGTLTWSPASGAVSRTA